MPLVIDLRKRKTKADPLLAVADKRQAAMRRAVYDLLRSIQDLNLFEITNSGLETLLSNRVKGSGLDHDQRSLQDEVMRTFEAGANFAIEQLASVEVKKYSIATAMAFSMQNPEVVAWLARYAFDFIRNITADQMVAMRSLLLEALSSGINPRESAAKLKPLLGLNSQQSNAVLSYRRLLEEGKYTQAAGRQLRDRRFDASLLRRTTLSQEQIDRMVQRYAERQLRYRAETIARTESIRAANQGQLEAWRQANAQGLLDASLREHWLPGPEACPQCDEIPSLNPGGVAIQGLFNTPYGMLAAPPAHPSCQCALGLS